MLHFEFPDRFRRAEFFKEINVANLFDALGEHLCCAADHVEIDAAKFMARRERFVTHPALSNHAPNPELPDYFVLIRLFPRRRAWAGRRAMAMPPVILGHL